MCDGCPPNDSALIQGPKGNTGAEGASATCEDGINALARIDTSFGSGIVQTDSSFSTIAYLIYPGTLNLSSTITKIYAIANTTTNGQLRIVSSLGTVATSTLFSNGNVAIIDLGSISNLSPTIDILQIQAVANSGQVELFALSLLSL